MSRHFPASGRNSELPSGKNHSRINRIAAILGAIIAAYFGYLIPGLYGATGLIISDYLLSPDLDGYRSNAKRRWRKVGLHWIFVIFERFPHRSWFTHGPVLANVVMIAYLLCVAAAVITLYDFYLNLVWLGRLLFDFVMKYPHQTGAAFIGYCAMIALHTGADWITGEGEKRED